MSRVRGAIAAMLLIAPVAVIVVTAVLRWSDLPGAIPTQWRGGVVTSRQPIGVFAATEIGTAVVAAAIGIGVLLLAERPAKGLVVCGLIGGVAAGSWIAAIDSALGRAEGPTGPGVLAIVVGVVWGAPIALLARGRTGSGTGTSTGRPASDAPFSEIGINPFGVLVGAGLGVGAVFLNLGPIALGGLVLVAIAALVTSIVRVRVGDRAVTVALLGFLPLVVLPRERIATASTARAAALRGLGLRFGAGTLRVSMPFGYDVRIVRDDGRRLDLTLRDPEAFLEALRHP